MSLTSPSLPKSISCLPGLSTIYCGISMLCENRAFMSPESCSKVLSTAGKPRHILLRQSRPYQPRACFVFRLSLWADPFLRWPALKVSAQPTVFSGEKHWAWICTAIMYNTSSKKMEYDDIMREISREYFGETGNEGKPTPQHCNMRSWTNHFKRIWEHHEGVCIRERGIEGKPRPQPLQHEAMKQPLQTI